MTLQPLSAECIHSELDWSPKASSVHTSDSYLPPLLKIHRVSSADSAKSWADSSVDGGKLAIGFMIAMPREHRGDEGAALQLELCLGLTEIPWDPDCHG